MIHKKLVADFEAGRIDNSTFSHPAHVYVIWALIHAHGTLEAIRRFEASLKRITAESGHPEKFNTTITYALAFLVAERITDHPPATWDEFAAQNDDLLMWPNNALTQLYPSETLHSPKARRSFLLPTVT
jgi:hypothetical protein